MPSYTIKNKKTSEEMDVVCSYSELQILLSEDENLFQKLSTPKIVSGVGGLYSKTDDGFQRCFRVESKKIQAEGNTIRT